MADSRENVVTLKDLEDEMITVGQAAELWGKSERWVQHLVSAGYISKPRKGRYPILEVIKGGTCYLDAKWLPECSPEVVADYVRDKFAFTAAQDEHIRKLEAENARLKARLKAVTGGK